MQTSFQVLDDLIHIAGWLPGLGPQRNRDDLTEPIQLQSTATDCREYGRIVYHLDFDLQLFRPNYQIDMSGRPGVFVRLNIESREIRVAPSTVQKKRSGDK